MTSKTPGRVELEELYPVFLKLRDRVCVVVGAGPVAASKVDALLACGAQVRLVAPSAAFVTEHPHLRFERKAFEPADLDGAWYAVAAGPPEVNRAVVAAAESRRIFVNAVDDPAVATAYLGGVVRRDGFVFALCGNGAAPALTGLLREALEVLLPMDFATWRARAAELRVGWRERGVPMAGRRPLLLEALHELYAAKPAPRRDVAGGEP